MGLGLVKLQWRKRAVTADFENGVRTYIESYLIETNDKLMDSVAVTALPGVPVRGQFYVGADGVGDVKIATARDIAANQMEESPYFWEVVVTYSNRTDQPERGNPDPIARPPDISWTNELQSFVAPIDLRGRSIVNSAGEKFADPPEENEIIQTYCVKRVLDYDPNPSLGQIYVDSVNSDVFMGRPPGYAKCTKLNSKRRYENNHYYYDVDSEIQCKNANKPYGWQPFILDQGCSTKDLLPGVQPHPILDPKSGQPISAALPLDGTGQLASKAVDAKLTSDIGAKDNTIAITTLAPNFAPWLTVADFPLTIRIDNEQMVILKMPIPGIYNVLRDANETFAAAHSANTIVQLVAFYFTFITHPSLPFSTAGLPWN